MAEKPDDMTDAHTRTEAFRIDQLRLAKPLKSQRERMDDEVRQIPFALPKKRDE